MSIQDVVKSKIYDGFFSNHNPIGTPNGFKRIIETINYGSSILDVGCGTGLYYKDLSICQLIKDKNLTITGIDIDSGAISICNKRINSAKMDLQVTAKIVDLISVKQNYDVVLFIESFPVIPSNDMKKYIAHALRISPTIFMYHNLVDEKKISSKSLKFLKKIKPILKYIILIDYGKVTTVNEMWNFLNNYTQNSKVSVDILLSATLAQALRLPKIFNLGYLGTKLDQYIIKITRI